MPRTVPKRIPGAELDAHCRTGRHHLHVISFAARHRIVKAQTVVLHVSPYRDRSRGFRFFITRSPSINNIGETFHFSQPSFCCAVHHSSAHLISKSSLADWHTFIVIYNVYIYIPGILSGGVMVGRCSSDAMTTIVNNVTLRP